ncbi:hypothetical protein P168DRAFT_313050 [Aspergillus campestris IBT 28561]|uniref:Uncharacterized protein n=1 Tax=Aspergillus campestris (strain IBT 28561) TaxID=1392248 RepID=A0A2I1CUI7_ASPC2|nr:uncharacterized protein P168DRAFT_313050 [Aspergillus campestris IBT 28561]PKY01296.1 hypothetical protein P168DRAFT_313050 [Aspergillus campestris IBT 28561]
MTIYIASLFLPYTVNFHVHDSNHQCPRPASPPPPQPSADPPNPAPNPVSLFEKENGPPTVGLTPGATTEHERIFSSTLDRAEHHGTGFPFPNPDDNINRMTESEAHSPAWGATLSLNQPRPQAAFSPSPSILKHQDSTTPAVEPRPEKQKPKPKAVEPVTVPTYLTDRRRRDSRKVSFSDASWTIQIAEQGNGGLRNAVRSATDAGHLEDKVWVGTLGMPTDALPPYTKAAIEEKLEDEYGSLTVYVRDGDFDGHYTHFCKTILWPVFHYQIPDNPKSKAYEDHSWIYYVKVNQEFANRIARTWKRGDSIWVQDYHLLLVPGMLRKLLPDAQIGFFLHIAFPSSEVFRCLAPRKELLQGMLGANLIGFQTDEYCRHFLQTCSRILNVEATNDGLQLEDRFVNVGKFPIGIDPTSWDQRRQAADVDLWIKLISERYEGKRLIVSRDKIDQVRGIRQKLLSYELFLNTYPEWRDQVVLIQVATSTTEQPELEATISDIAMRINSTHSNLAHQPLVFLKQDLAFPQYLALISVADALMITSLREGMNLTSHEFVYCQDGKYESKKKFGSLILSEFTGSASVFGHHALLVNPWDYRQCAEAIHTALSRSEEERQRVWTELHRAVLQNSTENWVKTFSETLNRVWNEQSSREIMAVPRLPVNKLEQMYHRSACRLIIMDYEGTLASWGSPKSIIVTTPQRAINTLAELTEDPKNIVYVMSSRMPEEMERLFRLVSRLGLIAENGCFVREPGAEEWCSLTDRAQTDAWKEGVSHILAYYQERAEGSWIEQRHCSYVFHYGSAEDQEMASRLASACAGHINDACASQGVHAIPVDNSLVVEPADTNKATATALVWRWCLEHSERGDIEQRPDFLLALGDGRDDEPVFRWANKLERARLVNYVMTVTLGFRSTEAKAYLTQGVADRLAIAFRTSTMSPNVPAANAAFEDATQIKPLGGGRYEANLEGEWCVGAVPHGGYTTSVFYRLALTHFAHAHPNHYTEPATPISMQLTFLRRTGTGPAILTVEDMKLGARTSTIHAKLSQPSPKAPHALEVKVAGYITVSPSSAEVGITAPTHWGLHPAVSLDKLRESDSDGVWSYLPVPFSEFRRAGRQVRLYGPDPKKAEAPQTGVVDQWAQFCPAGNRAGKWTDAAVAFLADMFPAALDRFDSMASSAEGGGGGGGVGEGGKIARFWYPTVTYNVDFKKRLPVGGADWLYSRIHSKVMRDGRTDIDVVILDEGGEVVAIASQVGLVVSSSRNLGKKAKI